jgi:hypothetical protein
VAAGQRSWWRTYTPAFVVIRYSDTGLSCSRATEATPGSGGVAGLLEERPRVLASPAPELFGRDLNERAAGHNTDEWLHTTSKVSMLIPSAVAASSRV